jgi:hypothetical protein
MASTKTTTKTTKKGNRPLQALKDARRREKTANPSVEGYNAALDTLISMDIASNEEKLKQLEKKPARGRPRVNKIMPDKTRSVTLPFNLWKIIAVDAEKEIRSANGQIEWIVRKHYNYYQTHEPAHEPEQNALIQNLDDEAEHLFEEDPLTPQARKELAKEKRANKKKAEEVRKSVLNRYKK